jgi:hypothetical protein
MGIDGIDKTLVKYWQNIEKTFAIHWQNNGKTSV